MNGFPPDKVRRCAERTADYTNLNPQQDVIPGQRNRLVTQSPEWQEEVLRLTGGRGVDLTVEVGGEGTLARSLQATRMGGVVSVIGGVSGFGGTVIDPLAVIGGAKRLHGIFVGSRVMLEELNQFVSATKLHPVIDTVFSFDEAPQAYQYLESGKQFGKVVIRVAD